MDMLGGGSLASGVSTYPPVMVSHFVLATGEVLVAGSSVPVPVSGSVGPLLGSGAGYSVGFLSGSAVGSAVDSPLGTGVSDARPCVSVAVRSGIPVAVVFDLGLRLVSLSLGPLVGTVVTDVPVEVLLVLDEVTVTLLLDLLAVPVDVMLGLDEVPVSVVLDLRVVPVGLFLDLDEVPVVKLVDFVEVGTTTPDVELLEVGTITTDDVDKLVDIVEELPVGQTITVVPDEPVIIVGTVELFEVNKDVVENVDVELMDPVVVGGCKVG
jgi:hypothetical protein